MSMPSSRLLVATTAGSSPCFRSSSICSALLTGDRTVMGAGDLGASRRGSVAPACAMTWAGASATGSEPSSRRAASSLSRAASRSVRRRELANTIVDRCSATRSTMCDSTWGQIDGALAGGSPSSPSVGCRRVVRAPSRSSTGTTTDRSSSLSLGGCTTVTVLRPAEEGGDGRRWDAPSPTGRCAAPGSSSSASSRSSESARWAPRLVPGDGVHLVDDDGRDRRAGSRAPSR